jgi:predicted small secreted protein
MDRRHDVFVHMKTKIRGLAPLLLTLVTLIVAACNNGSGTGY